MCIELPSLGMLQAVLVLAPEELPEECHPPDFGSRYQFHLAPWPEDKQGTVEMLQVLQSQTETALVVVGSTKGRLVGDDPLGRQSSLGLHLLESRVV